MRLDRVTITTEYDPDPDLSWLEQSFIENGRDRLATYGDEWHMVRLIATAYVIVQEDGLEAPVIIDASLWGIESDSDNAHVQEIGESLLEEIRTQLAYNPATTHLSEFPDEMVEWEMFA